MKIKYVLLLCKSMKYFRETAYKKYTVNADESYLKHNRFVVISDEGTTDYYIFTEQQDFFNILGMRFNELLHDSGNYSQENLEYFNSFIRNYPEGDYELV